MYFVTGTDTDVGKSLVSAILALGLGAHYWKPIQSGSPTDREWVAHFLPADRCLPEAYRLTEPYSPHFAARLDGTPIDLDSIDLPPHNPLIVEGAGGVLVPLSRDHLVIDLMVRLALPVIVVARSTLGTLNHTLLTLEALAQRHLTVVGLILNGPPHPDNARALATYGGVPILGHLPPMADLNPTTLREQYDRLAPLNPSPIGS